MPFVKLDCGMLNSTIWIDRPAREIFITALLMAEPITLDGPSAQIEVRTLAHTGWDVPPGNYGFVPAAGVGIVGRSGVEMELGLTALERLCSPEPDSRSSDFDGRRMVRVDGGYLILNYARYRDRDYTSAERQRRWRAKNRNAVTSTGNGVTSRQITHAEAEADSRSREEKTEEARNARHAVRLPPIFELTEERKQVALNERLDADRTFADFVDYWRSIGGAKGRKLDWDATWRVWCRNQHPRKRKAETPYYQIPDDGDPTRA